MIKEIPLCSFCAESLPEIEIDISRLMDIPEKLYPGKIYMSIESNIELKCSLCGKSFIVNEEIEIQ